MSDESPTERRRRLRWITFGELIAVGALAISAIGLWNSWNDGKSSKPEVVVEKPRTIPLALRGKVVDDARALVISPVESSHALDSATLTIAGRTIEVGSDGRLSASDVQSIVGKPDDKVRTGSAPVQVKARYVEAGNDRTGGGRYRIAYQWKDGGLFSGRELRFTGFSRG
jgi:hypothetical protein